MNKQTKGLFISLEGIEGVGKSTNAKFIQEYLYTKGINSILTREPGGTPMAENIRATLLSEYSEVIPSVTEILLFFAARVQHVENVIKPALAAGKWVICDRFNDSTYAYQCGGRGFDKNKFNHLMQILLNNFQPKLTFLLDLTVEQSIQRVSGRANKKDRFEAEKVQFFAKINKTFHELQKSNPDRIKYVDGSKELSEVQSRIVEILNPYVSLAH